MRTRKRRQIAQVAYCDLVHGESQKTVTKRPRAIVSFLLDSFSDWMKTRRTSLLIWKGLHPISILLRRTAGESGIAVPGRNGRMPSASSIVPRPFEERLKKSPISDVSKVPKIYFRITLRPFRGSHRSGDMPLGGGWPRAAGGRMWRPRKKGKVTHTWDGFRSFFRPLWFSFPSFFPTS